MLSVDRCQQVGIQPACDFWLSMPFLAPGLWVRGGSHSVQACGCVEFQCILTLCLMTRAEHIFMRFESFAYPFQKYLSEPSAHFSKRFSLFLAARQSYTFHRRTITQMCFPYPPSLQEYSIPQLAVSFTWWCLMMKNCLKV